MSRAGWLKIVNLLLAVDLVIIAATAILHGWIIQTGFYRSVHVPPGYAFLLLITAHLILNKGWIRSTYFKRR